MFIILSQKQIKCHYKLKYCQLAGSPVNRTAIQLLVLTIATFLMVVAKRLLPMLNCQLPMHNCQLPMLNCQCQLPTKLAVAKTPISIGSANCQQNWQLLKRQLRLAVETANRNWRQFWSQPRLADLTTSHIGHICNQLNHVCTANFYAAF